MKDQPKTWHVPRGAEKARRVSDLMPEEQALIRGMQRIGYGRILCLVVKNGLPCLDPPPDAIQHIKLNPKKDASSICDPEGFVLKTHHLNLVQQLREVNDGVIDEIEVSDGLPVMIRTRRSPGLWK